MARNLLVIVTVLFFGGLVIYALSNAMGQEAALIVLIGVCLLAWKLSR